MGVRTFAVALCLAATGVAFSNGSFSVVYAPPVTVELNIEQEITRAGEWIIYGGSGFRASSAGIEKLQPYTMACREVDMFLAFAELCLEGRAVVVGDGDWARAYLSVVW